MLALANFPNSLKMKSQLAKSGGFLLLMRNILAYIHSLLADNIKYFRSQRGLTQQELANLANINRSYLAGIEAGRRNVSLQTIEKLCTALKIQPSDIFAKRS